MNFFGIHNTRYVIQKIEGEEHKTIHEMEKDELINVIHELITQSNLLQRELSTMRNTMNKFLLKDHPEQLHALLKHLYETDKW